jgi:hypothetical protein
VLNGVILFFLYVPLVTAGADPGRDLELKRVRGFPSFSVDLPYIAMVAAVTLNAAESEIRRLQRGSISVSAVRGSIACGARGCRWPAVIWA